MSTIDLSLLPAPSIVEVLSFEAIYAERKAALVAHFPANQQEAVARALEIESEPMAKLLQENAYRELVWRQRVNEGARALMLAFASGTDLDQLAANVNLTRLVKVQQLDADTTVTTVETASQCQVCHPDTNWCIGRHRSWLSREKREIVVGGRL